MFVCMYVLDDSECHHVLVIIIIDTSQKTTHAERVSMHKNNGIPVVNAKKAVFQSASQ